MKYKYLRWIQTNTNETITILKAIQSYKLRSEGKLHHNKKSFVKKSTQCCQSSPRWFVIKILSGSKQAGRESDGGRQAVAAGHAIQIAHRLQSINTYYRAPFCPRAFPRKILHFPFYCLLLSFVSRRKPFGDNVPAGATRWVLSSVETL